MLYQKSIVSDEKNSFIFSGEPYNEDINLNEIAALEAFYKKNGYLPEKYINTFLNWLTYRARDNVTDVLDSVMDSSFAGKCAVAQSFYSYMLEKLGFEYKTFNVGDITDTYPIHALTCVSIPTIIDGEKSNKLFVLDPTFRQFCLVEENRLTKEELAKFRIITDFTYETFDLAFGNRILNQIHQFVPVYVACGGTKVEALDFLFTRKILYKIEGRFEDYIKNGLLDLKDLVIKEFGNEFEMTIKEINRLLKRL